MFLSAINGNAVCHIVAIWKCFKDGFGWVLTTKSIHFVSQFHFLLILMNTKDFWNQANYLFFTPFFYIIGCGGTIRIGNDTSSPIDTGVISTPNFPAKYAKELCIWHLIAPPGQKVFLKFDAFELEGVGSNGACTNDYVQVWYVDILLKGTFN